MKKTALIAIFLSFFCLMNLSCSENDFQKNTRLAKSGDGEAQAETTDVKITNSLGMKFVYIEPGTFMMGSPSGEFGRDNDERQHQVTLTKGYSLIMITVKAVVSVPRSVRVG